MTTDVDIRRWLANKAVRLYRGRHNLRLRRAADSVSVAKMRESHRHICSALRKDIKAGEWQKALMLFGNDSDAGFRFLEAALPHMEPEIAATCLLDGWMHGVFGEHAFLGGRRSSGFDLAHRTVALFRACPSVRPTDLPEQMVLYRGVVAKSPKYAIMGAFAVSWTKRRDIAAWFACRYNENVEHAWILTGTFQRDAILAAIDDREEAEIIVDPFVSPKAWALTGPPEHPNAADVAALAELVAIRRRQEEERLAAYELVNRARQTAVTKT